MNKIGFIGLGKMGKGMSTNLLKHGYSMVVYDINPEAIRELVEAGAKAADSPCEVAENSEFFILSLPYPDDVEQVITGADGILAGAVKGSTIIDTSTIDPATSRRLAEIAAKQGVDMLDAPVVGGGPRGAAIGKQMIIVGGKKDVYERCNPVLNVIGNKTVYAGSNGQGLIIKLCFNIYNGMCLIAAAESFVFGVKSGIDPKLIFEVINTAKGGDWLLENKCPYPGCTEHSPANRNFEPGFPLDLAAKDYGLVMSTVNDMRMPLMMANLTHQLFESARNMGLGNKDASAIRLLIQHLAGLDVDEN